MATLEGWPLARQRTKCIHSCSSKNFLATLGKAAFVESHHREREGHLYELPLFDCMKTDLPGRTRSSPVRHSQEGEDDQSLVSSVKGTTFDLGNLMVIQYCTINV